jgi:anti-sigma factor RsiW
MRDDCCSIGQQLAEYVYRELDEAWRLRVERHVRECPRCREDLTSLERTLALIEEVTLEPEEHLSEHFSAVVLAILQRRAADRFHPWRHSAAVAVLALGVFFSSLDRTISLSPVQAAEIPAVREVRVLAKEMEDPLIEELADRASALAGGLRITPIARG